MDAKELYDLYRPLWEKVPETRPDAGALAVVVLPAPPQMCACRFPGDKLCVARHQSERIAAAALCRVAVEEWLVARGAFPQLFGQRVKWCDPGQYFDEALNETSAPTIHHALVAAALAVAGEKK